MSLEEMVWHLINEHSLGASDKQKAERFDFLSVSKAGYEECIADEQRSDLLPLLEG